MSWLLPAGLVAAAVGVLAAGALHLITHSRPLAEPLPTARFIPRRAIRARTRSLAPSDLALLALRAAAILAVTLGVAGPLVSRHTGRIARVVVVDRSRDVGDFARLRDSARVLSRGAAAIVVFDSAAAPVSRGVLDSLTRSPARGSLSAALSAAIRAGAVAASSADSVEVAIISPFAAEEMDSATSPLRATWPGRWRLVVVPAARDSVRMPRVASDSGATDPVVAGLALLGVMTGRATNAPAGATANVRVVRGIPTGADSSWSRDSGNVLVHWPTSLAAPRWARRAGIDAAGAIVSRHAVVPGRFPRAWVLTGRTVARWPDGTPAAVEHASGAGCVRDVGVLVDPASDVAVGAPFQSLLRDLIAPCGGERRADPSPAAALAALAGSGPLAPSPSVRGGVDESSPATPWLLALGAALLVAELAARRTAVSARPVDQ